MISARATHRVLNCLRAAAETKIVNWLDAYQVSEIEASTAERQRRRYPDPHHGIKLIASRSDWSIPIDLADCGNTLRSSGGPQVPQGRLHICMAGVCHHRAGINLVPEPRRDAGTPEFVQIKCSTPKFAFDSYQAVPAPATFDSGPTGHIRFRPDGPRIIKGRPILVSCGCCAEADNRSQQGGTPR